MADWRTFILNERDPGRSEAEKLVHFEQVPFEEAVKSKYVKAAHACLYAKDAGTLYWTGNKKHAALLMQGRFDGQFGFPGGLLDGQPDEPPVDGLNREMEEEIGFDTAKHALTQENFIMANVNHKLKFVTFFYAKEFLLEEFEEIEKRCLGAKEWGQETQGTIRVPLFACTPHGRTAPRKGLPYFLCNRFPGNAKMQLLETLITREVLPRSELEGHLAEYIKIQTDVQDCNTESYTS